MNKVNELTSKVILESNPKFTPQGDVAILVENMADAVIYRKEGIQNKTADSLTFEIDISEHFFDRCMHITWESIPVTFTLTTPVLKEDLTEFTAIKELANVIYREGHMLNAISSINVTIDGQQISTNAVDKMYKIVSPYYEKNALSYMMDASLSDKNCSYLIDDGAEYIPSYSADGKRILKKAAKLNSFNPFNPALDEDVNSRIPTFSDFALKENAADTHWDRINCNLKNLTAFLPFNIFSAYNDETPIYNGNKLRLVIQLQSNWINRIFSMKPSTAGVTPVTVALNTSSPTDSTAIYAMVRLYKAPTKITENLDYSKPYIHQYPMVEYDSRAHDIIFTASKKSEPIVSTPFDCRAIPKKIYLAIVPKLEQEIDFRRTTNHYGRWDSLSLELHGVTTDIASEGSSELLYNICKENGLQMNKDEALYYRGFPLCIDVGNNIAGKGNSMIGIISNNSGKYTLRIKGTVTCLNSGHTSFTLDNLDTTAKLADIGERKYEFQVVFVYSTYFVYNMFGKKFSLLESLSVDQIALMNQNVNDLYQQFVPKMSVVGGSFLSALGPALKGVGQGLWNVVKAAISNKNGLRDKLAEAYKGGGVLDGHAPLMGGNYTQSRIIGGKSLLDYE